MRHLLALLCFVLLAAATGCSTKNPYNVSELQPGKSAIPLRAYVTDFDDQRGFDQEYNKGMTYIPLVPYGGYYRDRHDELHASATEPFPTLAAKALAERLRETGVFSQVDYLSPDETPELGEYDVQVVGTLNTLRSKGGVSRFGLSVAGDLLWEFGIPYVSRRWEIDVAYHLRDAYTGQALTQPAQVELTTSRAYLSKFSNHGRTNDLQNKWSPIFDGFVVHMWEEQPGPEASKWAQVKEQGQQVVAQAARREQRLERGTPPSVSIISPAPDSVVRVASAPMRWTISAPESLRTVRAAVNGRPISLNLGGASLAANATQNVQGQDELPLQLGANRVEILVEDHNGNQVPVDLNLTRLPKELNPPQRFALLLGADAPQARQSVNTLTAVLSDPTVGQFDSAHVQPVGMTSFDTQQAETAIEQFGRQVLAGQLAVVYVAAQANWADLTIGGTSMTVDDLLATLDRRLATDEVVVLLDLDWGNGGSGGGGLEARLENLPRSWAVVVNQSEGAPRATAGSTTLMGDVIAQTLRGGGSGRTLTLESFADNVLLQIAERAGSDASPEVYGRFNRSITMAERE